jgi:DNA-binding LacI/PurR family transcriptional regulator
MALGAIAEARSLRKIVPDEVSVVGFDGTPFAAFTDPPLTTLRQPVERMSTEVASLLLSPPNGSPPRTHTFLPELVVAGSTGPRR